MSMTTKLSRNIRSTIAASLTAMALTAATTPVHAGTSFFEDWHNVQNISVEYFDEKLSVTGTNIPLPTLLMAIQAQTGIPINYETASSKKLSVDAQNESIESVIAKISDNHLIIHAVNNGAKMVSEVIILPSNTKLNDSQTSSDSISDFLPTGEPAPAIAALTVEDKNDNKDVL